MNGKHNPITSAYRTIKRKLAFLEGQVAIGHFNSATLVFIKQEIHAMKVALKAIELCWSYGVASLSNRDDELHPIFKHQMSIEEQMERNDRYQANVLANLSPKKRPDFGR